MPYRGKRKATAPQNTGNGGGFLHAVLHALRAVGFALRTATLAAWHFLCRTVRAIPAALRALPQLPAAVSSAWRTLCDWLSHHTKRIHRRAKTVAHESRMHRFPESDRLPIRIILLLVGLMPACGALLRARLLALRKLRLHIFRDRAPRKQKLSRKQHALIFVAGALLLATILTLFFTFTVATTVTYRGTVIGVVHSRRAAAEAKREVEENTRRTLGTDFAFSDADLQLTTGIMHRSAVTEGLNLKEELSRQVGMISYGYSLYINDEFVAATPYPGTLESLLEQVKQLYVSDDTLTAEILEDVRIEEGFLPTSSLSNLGEIAQLLTKTKQEKVEYTVRSGDTWGAIAQKYELTNSQLLELNPGYNINKLLEGDVLTIGNAVPYLTVSVSERQNYLTDVPYEIEYIDDDTLYKGDYKIVSAGKYGSADVVADIVYVNGVETERTILSSVTLSDPVTEVRRRGTKERPTWMASGSFRWPITGRISSYFGYRNTGIRGASTNHKGIDITCSRGATICAADGGTVIHAGWWGAGGYTVIIDHGNGYCTYYEHNSSLYVRVGAHVYKGQGIAAAGRTGVASGVHCHFGITRNGVYVDPLKYLR